MRNICAVIQFEEIERRSSAKQCIFIHLMLFGCFVISVFDFNSSYFYFVSSFMQLIDHFIWKLQPQDSNTKTCFILRYFAFKVSTLQINKMRNKSHKNQDVLYCHKLICSQQTVFPYGEYDTIKILSSAEKDICYALFVTSPFRYNLDI